MTSGHRWVTDAYAHRCAKWCKMVQKLHKKAKRNDLSLSPKHKGMSKTSGGIGKKKDSENDNKEIEKSLFFLFASPKTQLYVFLNKFNFN